MVAACLQRVPLGASELIGMYREVRCNGRLKDLNLVRGVGGALALPLGVGVASGRPPWGVRATTLRTAPLPAEVAHFLEAVAFALRLPLAVAVLPALPVDGRPAPGLRVVPTCPIAPTILPSLRLPLCWSFVLAAPLHLVPTTDTWWTSPKSATNPHTAFHPRPPPWP